MAGQEELRSQLSYALKSALINPYQRNQNPAYASYSNYYANSATLSTPSQATTSQGYTLSSTYNPSQTYQDLETVTSQPSNFSNSQKRRSNNYDSRAGRRQNYWYEPGNHKCGNKQCNFTGSRNALEIHMMDRHLIFPRDWQSRKQPRTWDTDPELDNGKPLMILGTDTLLDSPEAVDMWIAERRKRWPSTARVEEKKQKLAEAIAHGQLPLQRDQSGRKRKADFMVENDRRSFDRPKSRIKTVVSKERPASTHIADVPSNSTLATQTSKIPHSIPAIVLDSKNSDSDPDSGSDMDSEKDAISSHVYPIEKNSSFTVEEKDFDAKDDVIDISEKGAVKATTPKRPIVPRPGKSIYNPFAKRNDLLQSLLNPEIRRTVSNFSKAIRFLVENDCLEGVEIKPGDAEKRHVEIIDDNYSEKHRVTE